MTAWRICSAPPVNLPAALRLGVVLLLLAAPAARAQDLDPAPWAWADGKQVNAVLWSGLETMPPVEALGMIETRPGATFQSETLSTDLGRLYRSGRFGSPLAGEHRGAPAVEVVVRPDAGGVIVEFAVRERPRARLIFEGTEELDDDWLEETVKVKDGDLLDPFGLERSVRALRQKLIDEGHLHAEVAHRVDAAPGREEVDAFITVRAGPKVYVDEILWEGATALDPSDLQGASGPDAMQTKPRELWGLLEKGTYKPDVFRQDLERVARYYRSQGWLDVKVYPLEERYGADGAALTLVVAVEEGDRYHVRRVGVEGTTVLPEDRLLREVPLRSGRPFLGEDLRGAIDRIRRLYGQRAYIHCEVDVDVRYDAAKKLLDVTLRVSEGPKVRIEEIRVDGNDKTQEKVIRRELSVYPGEYYDADQLEASVARLGRLRYFQDVRLDFAPGTSPGSEHLLIHVEEARTGAIIIGGGVSTAAGFFGNITLTQRNFDLFDPPTSFRDFIEGRAFTGAGQQLTITLQPGRQRSQYSIEFVEPWLLGFPVILELEAFARDRQREDWLETRRGGRATLGYRITQDLIVRASYRFERVRIADIEASAVPDVLDVAGTNYVGTVRFSASYDQNRYDGDQVLHGGYALSSYYEVADQALASDFDFQRAGGAANWQVTFFEWPRRYKWVAGLRTDVGWIEERHRSDSVPIFERFFAGGPGSVRGFNFRSVSPQLFDKPLGGRWLGVATAEASFPLFQNILRGVVFADAGGAVARFSDFERDDNIRVAAGFGFRLRVPVFPAPVALDFAWPLRKRRDDDPQIFSFSVGFGF
jgi:outer membrane protein insertion porin family